MLLLHSPDMIGAQEAQGNELVTYDTDFYSAYQLFSSQPNHGRLVSLESLRVCGQRPPSSVERR